MEGSEADEARFRRRKQKEGGFDSEEEEEERNFTDNIEKAVNQHSKKATSTSL